MTDFDTVAALIALLADPTAAQARLAELKATIDAAAAREHEADVAHAELGNERERLAKLEAALREREVAVFASESRHAAELEALKQWKRENTGTRLIAIGPGGLTKEPDDTPDAPDPITDKFAPSMREAHKPSRVRSRARA
jgi:hypothetical protein